MYYTTTTTINTITTILLLLLLLSLLLLLLLRLRLLLYQLCLDACGINSQKSASAENDCSKKHYKSSAASYICFLLISLIDNHRIFGYSFCNIAFVNSSHLWLLDMKKKIKKKKNAEVITAKRIMKSSEREIERAGMKGNEKERKKIMK